ncbi:MAG TPA: hypothetical protein VEC36_06955 [Patescibacteria group bacterium]|nr:hypothetical protein [Patescibacteria group bacterium]
MKKILLIILCTVFINSCTDNSVGPTPTGNGYFPLTLGSSWTYENSHSELLNGEVTISYSSIIGEELFEDGNSFMIKQGVIPNDYDTVKLNQFYRRSNDTVYYGFFLYRNDIQLIERYGATWSTTYAALPNPYTLTFTVTGKGLHHSVNGVNYTDVLRVRVLSSSVNYKGDTLRAEGIQYFAKNIGLIESISWNDRVTSKSRLKNYSIK